MINRQRVWLVAFTVGAIACGPVAMFSRSVPELIAVPIVFGAVYLTVIETASEIIRKKTKCFGK